MMDFFRVLDVSASALTAQRWRLNIIASNLANAQTTRTSQGGPYRRKDVVFATWSPRFDQVISALYEPPYAGVRVVEVVEDPRPPRVIYDPSHPDADENGYVRLPNVNPLEEMVNLIAAARSYEANLAVFNAAKEALLRALEIGRI
jgi:flagellar basal-body rod protein FlgC